MKKNNILSARLGYTFSDSSLFDLALSHRSIGKQNNERLEFLGDALLNFIIAEALFNLFPSLREGKLTRLRASLVRGETLAELARELDLGEHLLLGEGELKSGGSRRTSILADAMEAIIGAIYLDAGMTVCRERVLTWFDSRLNELSAEPHTKDPKTMLQEYLQQNRRLLPEYRVIESSGESHDREFVVQCCIEGHDESTTGKGSSKKIAEKQAAENMLALLGLLSESDTNE